MKHYAIYLALSTNGGCYWEVWTAGSKDDKKIASGTAFDVTQAMIHAGAWVGKKK